MYQIYLYSIVLLLAISVITLVICKKLNIPLMLGYLLVGLLCGSSPFTILEHNPAIEYIGEIGIVFLMFTIGLEFSLSKLKSMGKNILILGLSQIILTIIVFVFFGLRRHISFSQSFILASCLMVSSTAMVSKLLAEKSEINSQHGQMIMGVLLMQDIAVVLIIVIINSFANPSEGMFLAIFLAIIKIIILLFSLFYLGEKLIKPFFNIIARLGISELFLLNSLFITLGIATLTELAGLSMALGAFIAGMLLSETQYKYQLEDDIRPFKDILLGLFFVTVGLKLDINFLYQEALIILITALTLITIKSVIIILIGIFIKKKANYSYSSIFKTAIYLSQAGEFSFALITMSLKDNLISNEVVQLVTSVTLVSMILFPFLIQFYLYVEKIFFKQYNQKFEKEFYNDIKYNNDLLKNKILLIGYGSVGQVTARILSSKNINYNIIDYDIDLVNSVKLSGENIFYGDAKRKDILLQLVKNVNLVVISIKDIVQTEHILSNLMNINYKLQALVCVDNNNDDDIAKLNRIGAENIISTNIETGLSLATEVLLSCGLTFYETFSYIRNIRLNRYHNLKDLFLGSSQVVDSFKKVVRDSIEILSYYKGIGKQLKSLNLSSLNIELISIRKNNEYVNIKSLKDNIFLEVGDVLIIAGTPVAIEELKKLIISG